MEYEERIKRLEAESERTTKRLTEYGDALAAALLDLKRVCDAVATLGTGYTKLSDSVNNLDADQKKARVTMHKLENTASANGMQLAHLIDLNQIQTPILQRLDRVVMGDGATAQVLRDYAKRFGKWDTIILAILVSVATAFGTWVFARFTAVDVRQQKNEQKQTQEAVKP